MWGGPINTIGCLGNQVCGTLVSEERRKGGASREQPVHAHVRTLSPCCWSSSAGRGVVTNLSREACCPPLLLLHVPTFLTLVKAASRPQTSKMTWLQCRLLQGRWDPLPSPSPPLLFPAVTSGAMVSPVGSAGTLFRPPPPPPSTHFLLHLHLCWPQNRSVLLILPPFGLRTSCRQK